ncbi:MAG: hypothetical protein KBC02_04175 [Candidatus Pacebacteria bacterium]|nr:hypothetical protein [Candidatus Paceibacterota bacterium]
MGIESPSTPPPVEIQPKPIDSPESVAANNQQESTAESTEVEQQREARVAQLRAEILGKTEVTQEAAQQSSPESGNKQAEVEQLQKEMEAHQLAIEEIGRQIDETDDAIEAIKKEKGYEVRGNIGTPEDILAALIPNKRAGLENLNKILAAITDTSDKERFRTVIRTIERLSDEDVANMASSQSFDWYGINPARLRSDSVDYADLPKITGSEKVGIAVNELKRGQKKVQEVHDRIESDPNIIASKTTIDALRKKYYTEVQAFNDLQESLKKLEEANGNS